MKTRLLAGVVMLAALPSLGAAPTTPVSTAHREIQALYDQFSAAVKARDIDAIMAFYAPGETMVAFDAFPPRQYVGASSYRKAYEGFFAAYPGAVTSEISDLRVTAAGDLAIASCIDRWVATGSDGKPSEIVFRATNGFRKSNGRWLIIHEHLSVPVDPMTGMADLLSKP
jgi:uncharacterized protein (TIGR02246 family)